MKRIVLFILGLFLSVGSWAQDDYEYNYDYVDQWEIIRAVSPADGSKAMGLSVISDTYIISYGSKTQPRLYISCERNETKIFVDFDTDVVSSPEGSKRVTFQIDSEKAFELDTKPAPDLFTLFIPRPVNFIEQLYGHKSLLVRTQLADGAKVTLTFNISGLKEVITELRQTCNW